MPEATGLKTVQVYVRYREPEAKLANLVLNCMGLANGMQVPRVLSCYDERVDTEFVVITDNFKLTNEQVDAVIEQSIEQNVFRDDTYKVDWKNEITFFVDYSWV